MHKNASFYRINFLIGPVVFVLWHYTIFENLLYYIYNNFLWLGFSSLPRWPNRLGLKTCHPGGPGSIPGRGYCLFFLIDKKISKYLKSIKLLYQTIKYSIIFLWFQKKAVKYSIIFLWFQKKQWNIMSNHENIGPKLVK